jgi:hypothetical protein
LIWRLIKNLEGDAMKRLLGYWLIGSLLLAATIMGSRAQETTSAPGAVVAAKAESAADIRKEAKQRYQTGTKQDPETGKLFRKAADMGDPLATMWVARFHNRAIAGIPQDNTRAAELAKTVIAEVKRLAEAGDPEAQFLLGSAFSEALALPKNEQEGFKWLLAAAKQGDMIAMNNVADAFFNGRGTARNEATAFYWLKMSAEKGDNLAFGNLACYYHWGLGVEADLQQAREWYDKAERAGIDTSDDLKLLEPCWTEHPFKADAIRGMSCVRLFGLRPENFLEAAMTLGIIPAGAKVEESEAGKSPAYDCPAGGIRFGLRFGQLRSVELFAKGVQNHEQFKGTLPLGLAWDNTMTNVVRKLGPPDDSGAVPGDNAYGMAYTMENLTMAIMFSYQDPGHIKLVRIYEKWPQNAKGAPTRDSAGEQRNSR